MSTLPIYVSVIVLAGLIGTTATICAMLWHGARGTGHGPRIAAVVALIAGASWAIWVFASAILAHADVYRFAPNKAQPWLPVAMFSALAAVLLATRVPVVSGILAEPHALWRLTVPQYFRVEGVVFVMAMALGTLPAAFALPAGLGDIATGIGAVYVARSIRRGVVGHRATWFNILGLADLIVATTIGVAAAPGIAHVLSLYPTTEQLALLPLALIPTTVVPLAAALHVLSLRKIAVRSAPTSVPTPFGA
ncbi:hypothetical protein [Mycobacterium aquaticum]|uniref:Uncharacterized protein n=1 Tax=Mycobacterium aquaticum TaxID=1927124 RepID=A0A1X0B228_9MYCO|nr:hypothetical protein [Mycobacterium aquaticum]ORA35926.1 hypothetical protein BST13_13030 [Mycobacterium aquaticum]